jgi:hypothetical protein
MKYRKAMRKSSSSKYYRATADRTHAFNFSHKPVRGGFRLS